jgi:DNA-directed RNA polymerase subunit RPC12/RpoP
MATDSPAKCPNCGSRDGQPISSKDGYLNNPPKDGERSITKATVYVCTCGETFTVTQRRKGLAKKRKRPRGGLGTT